MQIVQWYVKVLRDYALAPSVGWIVLLTLCSIDSEPGENRYGANPKRHSTAFEDQITAS